MKPPPLTPRQEAQLDALASAIQRAPHNLVSQRERERIGTAHIPECLGVGGALDLAAGSRWVDVGTGGGLPGLVLAIAWPETHWCLVDSTRKKVAAVEGFVAQLGLENVEVRLGRAEQLARDPALRGAFDGAIARALGAFVVAAELCRGFVRAGGSVALVRGPRAAAELEASERTLPELGLEDPQISEVRTAPRPAWIVMLRAAGSPPGRIPRREGVPRSRPLGRS